MCSRMKGAFRHVENMVVEGNFSRGRPNKNWANTVLHDILASNPLEGGKSRRTNDDDDDYVHKCRFSFKIRFRDP